MHGGLFAFILPPMIRIFSLLAIVLLVGVAPPAQAAPGGKTRSLGKFGYWNAYQTMEGKDPVCYMVLKAKPPVSKKNKARRGDITLMVTHRPAEGSTDVVSYTAGTKYKPSSDVVAKIDQKEFNLFTQDDTAWARDVITDKALAQALRAGSSLVLSGFSSNNQPFADQISLRGSAAAYAAMSEACGVRVDPVAKAPPAQKAETKKSAPKKTSSKKN